MDHFRSVSGRGVCSRTPIHPRPILGFERHHQTGRTGRDVCQINRGVPVNWKLIFSLSSFGIAISFSQIFGYGPLLVWPIVLVVSVCLITARATNRIPLHGFLVGAMIQIWVGAITAYLIFDLSRIGLVE